LVHWKGHEFLIRALAEFRRKISADVHLTLLGDGELKQPLQALVANLGLNDAVSFLGRVAHGEIPQLLAAHDVYVQPSIMDVKTKQTETFGVAALEAIAAGLPVIVSDVGGLPYVVGKPNEFAKIVPAGDVNALVEALKGFTDNAGDNLAYAQQRVAEYSSTRQITICKKIYAELSSHQ
jgi:glycosyltransferase involved in cell wall biosynthesis